MPPKAAPPKAPAKPAARPSGSRPSPAADGERKSWLPMIFGLAVLAGLLGLVYKLYIDQQECRRKLCPRIDPKIRKWPIEKKELIPWTKIKKAWSCIMEYICKKQCPGPK